MDKSQTTREGFLYGVAAYGMWGLVPLYFRALRGVPSLEILAHRIVWSVLFLAGLLAWFRLWPELRRGLTHPLKVAGFLLTASLVALNWYVFILCVERGEVKQASLGYYITPLVSVLLGLTFLREKLRTAQIVAVALAATGVGQFTWEIGVLWYSLILAASFSLYGLVRKRLGVDGLVGLGLETIYLLPLALSYLAYLEMSGELTLGSGDSAVDVLLLCSGIITAVPLVCFGQATLRLPLSALGFLQYFSPTIQLVLALLVFQEEPLPWLGLTLIWIALALFTGDAVRHYRREPAPC